MMQTRFYRFIGSILLLFPVVATALGLGAIQVDSFLNQPLRARIGLLSADGVELEDVRVGLADAATFAKAGLPRPFILSGLRFRVEKGDAPGQAAIVVTSRDPITEPFLDFLVSLDWKGNHLVRQYTLLLDPPVSRPRARSVRSRPAGTPKPAAPSPAPSPPPAVARSVDSYGPVRRSETLWVIARKLRPDGAVTVEQMMMALQRANPEAFRFGNVNYLKQGVVLQVPDREEILSITPRQARRLFREQNDAWKRLRAGGAAARAKAAAAKKAVPAAAPPVAEAALPAGEIAPIQRGQGAPAVTAPEVTRVPPKETAEAQLRVVEPDQEWLAGQKNLTGKRPEDRRYPVQEAETLKEAIADSRQSLEAVREINRDLEQLRGVLEKKIDTLRQSLEERDRLIADLQQRLERMSRQQEQAAKAAPAKGKPPAPARPGAAPGNVGSELAAAAMPARKPVQKSGWEQALEWARAEWLLLAIGAVVVLLVLLLILLLRRRHHVSRSTVPAEDPFGSYAALEEEIKAGGPAEGPPVETEASAQQEEDEEGFFVEPGADVASSLTEADIYLAYRRYSQAEALIKEAIKANPDSLVLKAKLLEIYAFRKDKRHFVPYLEEVSQSMAAEAPELWAKVVAMGCNLAPEHPLINAEAMTDLLAEDGEFSENDDQFELDTELQPLDLEPGDDDGGRGPKG